MALPTVQKTWQYNVNQALTSVAVDVDAQQLLFMIKQSLVGFASGQWSVTSSSDGTTPNLSDNWLAYTNLVFASGTSAHAWIVLTNSATGAQLCIDCNVGFTVSETCPVYFSPGGGYATTGLVTTARPTPPADEVQAPGGIGSTTTGWSGKVHAMMSNDGECTRVVVCRSGFAVGLWLIDAAQEPVTGWTTDPNFIIQTGTTSAADQLTYAAMNDAAVGRAYSSGSMSLYATSEGYGSAMIGENLTVPDAQTGAYALSQAGIASNSYNHQGWKGAIYDAWWGPTVLVTGDTYPAAGTYLFAQFGDLVLPWNGTAPQVT